MGIKAEASSSLKDELFNRATVRKLSTALERADSFFARASFERAVLKRFPELELKARIDWIVEVLGKYLPDRFPTAVATLTAALPPPLDAHRTDDDFGEFIWVVLGEYVARHGCSQQQLKRSLRFLQAATQRFSAEGAIRPFLLKFPDETMAFMHDCAQHQHYHVRRLASEGTRPYLPWAQRVLLPPKKIIEILNSLHADATRFVTRSVANNLNDLSKIDLPLVIRTLKRWKSEGTQSPEELTWMARHALRTARKMGDPNALEFLGYSSQPKVRVEKLTFSKKVNLGDALRCTAQIESQTKQRLAIGLRIYFLKANGTHTAKLFAIKDVAAGKGDMISIEKKHPFKAITTRTLYVGPHFAELMINGVSQGKRSRFLLATS